MVKEFYSKSSRDVDSRWAEDALMKDEVCRPFYTFSERQMNQMPQNCGKLAICRFLAANALPYFSFYFLSAIMANDPFLVPYGKCSICRVFIMQNMQFADFADFCIKS